MFSVVASSHVSIEAKKFFIDVQENKDGERYIKINQLAQVRNIGPRRFGDIMCFFK